MRKVHRPRLVATAVAATALLLLAGSLSSPISAGEEIRSAVAFEGGSPSFADVLAKAKSAGRPVFIDFWADG